MTGERVGRIRFYEAVGGIGSARPTAERVAEQCSEERHCPYFPQGCPMRQPSGGR